jgi:hypothetical protein
MVISVSRELKITQVSVQTKPFDCCLFSQKTLSGVTRRVFQYTEDYKMELTKEKGSLSG